MKGFSLLEVISVLAIIAIIAVILIPSQKRFLTKTTQQTNSQQLLHAINLARTEAITREQPVTLCGSQDGKFCSDEWNHGYIVLVDQEIIHQFTNADKNDLHWRAFPRHTTHLQFLPSGQSNMENGTFWHCDAQQKDLSWAIAVSQMGRARIVSADELCQQTLI